MTLVDLLLGAIRALWPRRPAQELLLDLPRRKPWAEADARAAAERAAAFITEELGLPEAIAPADVVLPSWAEMRAGAARVLRVSTRAEVEQRLSDMVGTKPATVRNALGAMNASRKDHRWIAALAAAGRGESWPWMAYHQRTRANMTSALARLAAHVAQGVPDAADALIVASLLALWQRRRDPRQARGTRGTPTTRRALPKPIASLAPSLFDFGALRVPAILKNHQMSQLALEWAFTVVHLAPHPAIRDGQPERGRFTALERALQEAAPVLGSDHLAWADRLAALRAYAESVPVPEPTASGAYFDMHRALLQARTDAAPRSRLQEAITAVSADQPGSFMLAPQVRSAWRRLD